MEGDSFTQNAQNWPLSYSYAALEKLTIQNGDSRLQMCGSPYSQASDQDSIAFSGGSSAIIVNGVNIHNDDTTNCVDYLTDT